MCFCVRSGYSARLRLWAVVQFIYCVFECVSVCIFIYIYKGCSAQQDGTRLGLIRHSSQAVIPHKRHQTIKKVNSRKHIQHDARLLLHVRCV